MQSERRMDVMRYALWLMAVLILGGSGAAEAADSLLILEAVYGDLPDGGKVDVTTEVARLVDDGSLRLEATNVLFGDPAEQESKTLQVSYSLNGDRGQVSVKEGETLLIPMPELKGDLELVEATYGVQPDGIRESVLTVVKTYLKDNRLEMAVNNELLGDPASGFFKSLRVVYKIGDVQLAKSVYEGGTIVIEAPAK
ncbi:DUF3395 domain-containing protein [bacterium]|nr:DUF3395 domain-containing protein [bacterium]